MTFNTNKQTPGNHFLLWCSRDNSQEIIKESAEDRWFCKIKN